MQAIDTKRTGEYLKTALLILKQKGGELPSNELIQEMGKRLTLTPYEQSLNKSGQTRWITRFRFYTIGLVKGGWIVKNGRTWKLTDLNKDIESMTPEDLTKFTGESYDKWNNTRFNKTEIYEIEDVENDEPEILMEVKPDDISFQKLITGISAGTIQIPPFQRSFVWKTKDIRFLLDSIYRGYPIGSFIFWETARQLPRARTIGNIELHNSEIHSNSVISYVLDGQQRITSLFAAVKGSPIDDEYFRFLFDIREKKFIVSKTEPTDKELLRKEDCENLQISIETIFIESRATYNDIIRQYPSEYATFLDTLYDRFNSYRFSLILVIDQKYTTEEEQSEGVRQVVRMFSRINETGQKLTVVAKMVARCWGEGYDLREALNSFFSTDPALITIREETLLQAMSVILNFRKARSRDILERTNIRKLELEWNNIIEAFNLALEFVRSKIKIKKLEYLPFDAVLVPLSYIFYKQKSLNNTQTNQVEQWFWKACLSNRYGSTVESKIEDDCLLFDQILENKTIVVDFLIDWDNLKNNLIAERYNLRNAFVKTILSLYSYAEPKNLFDGRDVNLDHVFSGYYKHNFHHIFPQAYLRNNELVHKDLFDSMVNIMFIPAITNNDISDKDPKSYFNDLKDSNLKLQDILQHHYIPDLDKSGLLENKFLEFLDYRSSQIVKAFRVLTGIGSPSEEFFVTNPTKPIDILEIKMRNLIHDKLSKQTEGSYWKEFIPPDIQDTVNRKIKIDIKRNPYELDEYEKDEIKIKYLDIMDYPKIILSNWPLFEEIFGSKQELEKHFLAILYYRNPVKHSRDFTEVDRRNGEAAVIWFENIIK